MLLSAFISLLIATAYAQSPTTEEYLVLHAAPAIMIKVAECESGLRQFYDSGAIVADSVTGDHVGLFQISRKLHAKQALKNGWDIETPAGNVAEALWLYKKNGLRDWKASQDCWAPSLTLNTQV